MQFLNRETKNLETDRPKSGTVICNYERDSLNSATEICKNYVINLKTVSLEPSLRPCILTCPHAPKLDEFQGIASLHSP